MYPGNCSKYFPTPPCIMLHKYVALVATFNEGSPNLQGHCTTTITLGNLDLASHHLASVGESQVPPQYESQLGGCESGSIIATAMETSNSGRLPMLHLEVKQIENTVFPSRIPSTFPNHHTKCCKLQLVIVQAAVPVPYQVLT